MSEQGDMPARGGPQHIPRPPTARAGARPPWADIAAARRVGLDDVRAALDRREASEPSAWVASAPRAAAVLVPLYEEDGELHVVLTRRAWHLRAHRGEVSFPGGGRDPQDRDLVATALREAQEEIGLDPADVEIIGELEHLRTVSSESEIVPYVGALRGRPSLTPNPNEVDAILHVPVAELLLDEVYRAEVWAWGGFEERSLHFFELHGDTVWGATAAMLHELLALVMEAT